MIIIADYKLVINTSDTFNRGVTNTTKISKHH